MPWRDAVEEQRQRHKAAAAVVRAGVGEITIVLLDLSVGQVLVQSGRYGP
ncbi:hypothetical protein [Nitrosospira multiformis]|nr:hypothetical protein [Nitrosospira multiformis]